MPGVVSRLLGWFIRDDDEKLKSKTPPKLSFDWAEDSSLEVPAPTRLPLNFRTLSPVQLLQHVNSGRAADFEKARSIAAKIRDPNYTLRQYHDDLVVAFPEMTFYMIEGSSISSGGTPAEEYKRTIGAAFAFYWLMRIGIDGECGFCFGVDADWRPIMPPNQNASSKPFPQLSETERRIAFYVRAPWDMLHQLMVDSGCLKKKPKVRKNSLMGVGVVGVGRRFSNAGKSPGAASGPLFGGGSEEHTGHTGHTGHMGRESSARKPNSGGEPPPCTPALPEDANERERKRAARRQQDVLERWEVDIERTVAMLVLTAIHDIMKVEHLLPTVDAEHAPHNGYCAGDTIQDHDAALAYVLEAHGTEALPSFAGLAESEQKLIRFTQSRIAFNHGWLVQAEAPPGALLSRFKEVILAEGLHAADIAFYFVHWITDLSGAVPTPLRGSEKFVVQFPHFVLDSFIESFPLIHTLADRTETQVLESYLTERWKQLSESGVLGPTPTGEEAIAQMRLVVQAQNQAEQQAVAKAWGQLSADDRRTLSLEMAATGIATQAYTASPATEARALDVPAVLIYYSPAFLRTVAKHEPLCALQMLAAIYRGARALWPPAPTDAEASALPTAPLPLKVADPSSTGAPRRLGRSDTVVVRIDQLKDLDAHKLRIAHEAGDRWYVCKRSTFDAVVIRHNELEKMPVEMANGAEVREVFICAEETTAVDKAVEC